MANKNLELNAVNQGDVIKIAHKNLTEALRAGTDLNGVDLDTVLDSGIYVCRNGNSTLHYPSGTNGILVVIKDVYYDSIVKQFYFRIGTTNASDFYWYSRQIAGSTIGNWIQFTNGIELNRSNNLNNATLNLDSNGFPYIRFINTSNTSCQFIFNESVLKYQSNSGGSWTNISVFDRNYQAGDTWSRVRTSKGWLLCAGHLVTSTSIIFTIPFAKPINASSVAFTKFVIGAARGISGTNVVSNTDVATDTNYTLIGTIDGNTINCTLTIPTTTATPVTAINVAIGDVEATFS